MPRKKITQEEYQKRLSEISDNFFIALSEYQGSEEDITIKCIKHNIVLTNKARRFIDKSIDHRCTCPECKKEKISLTKRKEGGEFKNCAYCGKTFWVNKARINNNKTGLFFCCNEHFTKAKREAIDNVKFKPLIPSGSHLGKGYWSYRKRALENYSNKCAICGFNEDNDLLEVHHIDENRQNNALENLIILCPICHKKLSTHKYKLINRTYLQKI